MDSQIKLFSDEEIQDIINKDILEIVGAENMPEDQKQELYLKMGKTIQLRVAARIDDSLAEEEREEWKKVLEKGDIEEMKGYLKGKDIDLPNLILEEALIYKTEIISLFKNLKEKNG